MCYTNILSALDLAGIELLASNRKSGPFVICGGPCACNPEPLAPFVDAFAMGDGEELTLKTIEVYRKWRDAGLPREKYLEMLAQLDGIYVPSLYDIAYKEDGTIANIQPHAPAKMPVMKALVNDLTAADYPDTLVGALWRSGAQPHYAGNLSWMYARMPLLPGGHDLPGLCASARWSGSWNWRKSLCALRGTMKYRS